MAPEKRRLLERIDRDRELLINFLQEFIRCPTPNPPGGTRIAARQVQKLLDTHGVAYRVIASNEIVPKYRRQFFRGQTGSDSRPQWAHRHFPSRIRRRLGS